MNSNVKTLVLWLVIIMVVVMLWAVVRTGHSQHSADLTFTELMNQIDQGKIKSVEISGTELKGKNDTSEDVHAVIPSNYQPLVDQMLAKHVAVTYQKETSGNWVSILVNAIPFVLLLGFWIFMMRQMQSGGNKALSFGKSRARLHSTQQKKVTFKDVAGVEEAKEELQEIIEFLREPQKFQKLGGRIPKGVLLIGSPGTGKTLLARAIAGEANVPFFSISGFGLRRNVRRRGRQPRARSVRTGQEERPLHHLHRRNRRRRPPSRRGPGRRSRRARADPEPVAGGNGRLRIERRRHPGRGDQPPRRAGSRAAAPRPFRPSRGGGRPDVKGRESILQVHTKKIPLADDVDLSVLARGTPGFAGADLANLVNEAALVAARQNRKVVTMFDFELAKDKVLMGVERKSLIISEKEKRITAYHEAGHALVAAMMPNADPLHKVTIIPRGMALGITMQLPIDDKLSLQQGLSGIPAGHSDGRPHRRRDLHPPDDHRRGQRHRARHRHGPQDGLRMGHERPGPAELRQEGRADLPWPRDRPASRLQRRNRHPHRRAGEQVHRRFATAAPAR